MNLTQTTSKKDRPLLQETHSQIHMRKSFEQRNWVCLLFVTMTLSETKSLTTQVWRLQDHTVKQQQPVFFRMWSAILKTRVI